jgi:hypothetical protein
MRPPESHTLCRVVCVVKSVTPVASTARRSRKAGNRLQLLKEMKTLVWSQWHAPGSSKSTQKPGLSYTTVL